MWQHTQACTCGSTNRRSRRRSSRGVGVGRWGRGSCNNLYFKFTHCWDSKFNFIVRCVVIILHNNISGNCFEIPGGNPETSLLHTHTAPPSSSCTQLNPTTRPARVSVCVFALDYSILFQVFPCLHFRAQQNELNFCVNPSTA